MTSALEQILSGLVSIVMILQASTAAIPKNQLAQVIGQNDVVLSLASGSASIGGTVALNISIDTSAVLTNVSGVQWDFTFNPSEIASVSIVNGSSAVSSDKDSYCYAVSSGAYRCLVIGFNGSPIPSGPLSIATFTLTSSVSGSVSVGLSNSLATNSNANSVPISSTGGNITIAQAADTTKPSTPGRPSFVSVTSSQINLSWISSTDNVGVVNYLLSRCNGSTSCTSYTQIATTSTNSYSDTSLSASTIYRYRVRASDAAGNLSSNSNAAATTTKTQSAVNIQRKIILTLEGAPSNQRGVAGTVYFYSPTNLSSPVYQQNFTANSSGEYTITITQSLPSTVTIRISILGYLSRVLNNIDMADTRVLDISFSTLLSGDFNNDGIINSLDFSYMNDKWSGGDSLADVNRDGVVNSLDFAYISNNWLKTGE